MSIEGLESDIQMKKGLACLAYFQKLLYTLLFNAF